MKYKFILIFLSGILFIGLIFLINHITANSYFYYPIEKLQTIKEEDYSNIPNLNNLFIQNTKYSGVLDGSIDQTNFNYFEINLDTNTVLSPTKFELTKDTLFKLTDGNNNLGTGIIYSNIRGCFHSCKEGELERIFFPDFNFNIYDIYRGYWFPKSSISHLEFFQSKYFNHIIINQDWQSDALLEGVPGEVGFIITDINLTEFDQLLFQIWIRSISNS